MDSLDYMGLNSVFSQARGLWRTGSRTFNQTVKQGAIIGNIAGQGSRMRNARSNAMVYGGIAKLMGSVDGEIGRMLDAEIKKYQKEFAALARSGRLTNKRHAGLIGNLNLGIDTLLAARGGAAVNPSLAAQSRLIGNVYRTMQRGGAGRVYGAAQGFSGAARNYAAMVQLSRSMASFSRAMFSTGGIGSNLSQSIGDSIRSVFDDLDSQLRSTKTEGERFKVLDMAQRKIRGIGAGATTQKDRDATKQISEAFAKQVASYKDASRERSAQKVGAKVNDALMGVAHAAGTTTRALAHLGYAAGLAVSAFTKVNQVVNRFAKMQMAISRERGMYSRLIRGSGMDFHNLLVALRAGRKAGMDDREVVNQMASLQEKIALARWGEGTLINDVGRWGGSPFKANGEMKSEQEMMIEFSRIINSLGSDIEKMQFLSHIGFRPEQREYVENYEKEAARMERMRADKSLRGTLEDAEILGESGIAKKIDAATRIELRRREILNQNAIDQGPVAAIKRMLNPENWFFSDWTARQRGVQTAKAEIAQEKLTNAILELVEEEKKNGTRGGFSAKGLSVEDLMALAHIGDADKANRGKNSHFHEFERLFMERTGLNGDARKTAFERVMERLTTAMETLSEKIISLADWAGENPKTAATAAVGVVAGLLLLKKTIGMFCTWLIAQMGRKIGSAIGIGGGAAAAGGGAVIGGGAAAAGGGAAATGGAAAAAASKPSIFKRAWTGITSIFRKSKPTPETVPTGGASGAVVETPTAGAATNAGRINLGGKMTGTEAAAARNALLPEINAMSKSGSAAAKAATEAAKTSSKIAGATSAGAKVAGKGLGRFIPGVGTLITAGFTAYEAATAYSRGDTKSGNRAVTGGLGFLAGSALGAKVVSPLAGAAAATGIGAWLAPLILGAGAVGGGLLGMYGAGGISDWASDKMGVKDSTESNEGKSGEEGQDKVVNALDKESKVIEEIRNYIKSGKFEEARKALSERGLGGIPLSMLRSDQFMEGSMPEAHDLLYGTFMGSQMYGFRKEYGVDLDPTVDYKDKYIKALNKAGFKENDKEMREAYARVQGITNAVGNNVLNNYLEKGWMLNTGMGYNENRILQDNDFDEVDMLNMRKAAEHKYAHQDFTNMSKEDIELYNKEGAGKFKEAWIAREIERLKPGVARAKAERIAKKEFGAEITRDELEQYAEQTRKEGESADVAQLRVAREFFGGGAKYEGANRDFANLTDAEQQNAFAKFISQDKTGMSNAGLISRFARENQITEAEARDAIFSKSEATDIATRIDRGENVNAEDLEWYKEWQKGAEGSEAAQGMEKVGTEKNREALVSEGYNVMERAGIRLAGYDKWVRDRYGKESANAEIRGKADFGSKSRLMGMRMARANGVDLAKHFSAADLEELRKDDATRKQRFLGTGGTEGEYEDYLNLEKRVLRGGETFLGINDQDREYYEDVQERFKQENQERPYEGLWDDEPTTAELVRAEAKKNGRNVDMDEARKRGRRLKREMMNRKKDITRAQKGDMREVLRLRDEGVSEDEIAARLGQDSLDLYDKLKAEGRINKDGSVKDKYKFGERKGRNAAGGGWYWNGIKSPEPQRTWEERYKGMGELYDAWGYANKPATEPGYANLKEQKLAEWKDANPGGPKKGAIEEIRDKEGKSAQMVNEMDKVALGEAAAASAKTAQAGGMTGGGKEVAITITKGDETYNITGVKDGEEAAAAVAKINQDSLQWLIAQVRGATTGDEVA